MTYIPFKSDIAKNKPNTIANPSDYCPFCDRATLRAEGRIIKETVNFLILENKFPVMEGSFPTVLVETPTCEGHIGTYSLAYLTELLSFALDYYNELSQKSDYKSIALLKNYGPFSGGSIRHEHCQIIGFKHLNYQDNLHNNDFEGIPAIENENITVNVSTSPRSEFYELNIILKNKNHLDSLALYLQKAVNFILNILNKKNHSYNFAFYIDENDIKVKIFSRGPTTVLLLGYGIQQLPNNLDDIAIQLRQFIINDHNRERRY
jgi:ATP adenylyltransferase/5',5'''-P-1,P-4-tetraphosphate phosphorylase II